MAIKYDVVALSVTLWFNKYGDHDHNGLMYVLQEHQDIINYLKDIQEGKLDKEELFRQKNALIIKYGLTGNTRRIEEWLPDTKEKARQPHPLIVPLVLRASLGDTITINLKNEIKDRQVGIHLVGPGTDAKNDGSHIGKNQSSLVAYQEEKSFIWQCDREGVFVFHDAGDFRGDERGTNTHGLFGALIVEPASARWTDPETGGLLKSGLYADVHQRSETELETLKQEDKLAPYPNANNPQSLTTEYPAEKASFREFVIFFHDEPHWVPPHEQLETNPCDNPNASQEELMHEHTAGSLMPISYRAEPMISRERELWKRMKAGEIDPHNIVVNEEQHHSSWLFGDPCTPILKAYLGDPVRIRLVHAGVKETHVFHLHVYEWNAIPFHRDSNIIDAITISPQVGYTIVPFYGAGNRQMVPGDVIWHCHLYPHFHHGMWGIFRTFDKLQEGIDGKLFHSRTGEELTPAQLAAINAIGDRREETRTKNKLVRQLGRYPNLTPIHKLVPLPDREAPPKPTLSHPGYPLFIAGEVGQKSFTPPWHQLQNKQDTFEGLPVTDYDYRQPTQLELNAFNHDPRPGELFTTFAYPDRDKSLHKVAKSKTVKHNIDVLMTPIKYNDYGWWDPHGHLYALADEARNIKTFSELVREAVHHATHHLQAENPNLTIEQAQRVVASRGVTIKPTKQQPLFLRCRKTEVMQLTLHNRLERYIPETPFDSAWPKGIEKNCQEFASYRGECGLHVHIVKFDPICSDGASTGWNYISAPRFGKKLVYRWWADEEFGTIFTHDHLFANYRQKHGLFGALLVEPEGATFHDPENPSKQILVGQSAVIRYQQHGEEKAYREFCFGNADWVPLFEAATTNPHSGHNMGAIAHGDAEMTENFIAQAIYEVKVKDKAKIILQKINITYGMPLEPPNMQDSHDDNGVFGVNYRCEPLHERRHDPSEWFNSKKFLTNVEEHSSEAQKLIQYGDPNTAVFHTLPGEPVRLRLVQGSHEEQHSFQLHGLRWQRFWQDKYSPLRNQQTLGTSEAFSFDLDRNYGAGDYLWKYSSSEDLWLGCWGIIRAHAPNSHQGRKLQALTADYTPPEPICPPPLEQCRRFKVVAKAKTIPYSPVLKDPFGLVFNLVEWADPGQSSGTKVTTPDDEPLVLRCRQGEWVALELVNQIPEALEVEPLAPELPHDDATRRISNRVSIHADLVTYDVIEHDGANVGFNQNSTVDNSEVELKGEKSHTYFWLADRNVGAVLLQDMADFRNHRHHGLIGALVVEDPETIPYAVAPNTTTATLVPSAVCWHGARATIYHKSTQHRTEEMVLLVQDGLRYFLHGNPALPIGDIPGDLGEDTDTEDQGLKGFNYRSEPSSHERGYAFTPSTPLFKVSPQANVKLHLVGACDKPRNHSFTLHGHSWKEWEYLGEKSPQMSSTSGITSGFVQTYYFIANKTPGDYMYRSGVLKYAVEQGLWGIMRVSNAD